MLCVSGGQGQALSEAGRVSGQHPRVQQSGASNPPVPMATPTCGSYPLPTCLSSRCPSLLGEAQI